MRHLFHILLLSACTFEVPKDGFGVKVTEEDDTGSEGDADTDADTDTDTPPPPDGGNAVLHFATGPCTQGETIDLDLNTSQVFVYQIEVQYSDGTFEPMQAAIHTRPGSIAAIDGAITDYDSPIYRLGEILTFRCGYEWDVVGTGTGIYIDGVNVGQATSYRVTWFTEATP